MRHPDDDLLWDLLEQELDAREHAILTKRLQEDIQLQRRFEQLAAMHNLLNESLPALDTTESVQRIVEHVRDKRKRNN